MKLATPQKRGWRYIRNLALFTLGSALLAAYVVLPIGLAAVDVRRPPARLEVCCFTPADLSLEYEDVTFPTRDGLALSGWYIPSKNGAAIIAAHARNGNRTGMIYHAGFLAQHGYGVLLLDLRGHGNSEGKLWLYGWQGHLDVLGALAYLQNRPDVNPNRIGAVGLSAGAEAVLHAAAVNDQIKAVVSDGADYRVLKDMYLVADPATWAYAPGWLVYFSALTAMSGVTPPPSLIDLAPRIAPRSLLLIAAGPDTAEEIKLNRIYYVAAGEPKQLWELPDSTHIRGLFSHPKEYQDKLLTFFDQALLRRNMD
jgi:pimeloyl-ACP methyl ester carboxylesterase